LTSETVAAPIAGARSEADRPHRRDVNGPFEFAPHRCFACGELNEHGLHLDLHVDPEGAWTELTLQPQFQGWEAVAHGGIVSTLLDEVMAWSVIGRGTWGVTVRLNATFRKPIPTGRTIRAEGRVVELNRRASRTEGRVIDPATGDVFATADGSFMALPETEIERLKVRYGMRRLAEPTSSDTTDRKSVV